MALMDTGVYGGKMQAISSGLNSKNNPQIEIIWKIQHIKNKAVDGGWEQIDAFERRTFLPMSSEKALEFSFQRLKKAGFSGNPSDPKIEDFPANFATGIPIDCWTEPATEQYKAQQKWAPSIWNEGGGSSIAGAMADDQQAIIDQQWANFQAASETPSQ